MTRAADQLSLLGANRPRKRDHAERRLHIAVADTIRVSLTSGWWWCHIPNGEYRPDETGAVLKRMGVMAGVFDLLLLSPEGRPHWLEFKAPDADLDDPAQQEFARMLRRMNLPYAVARSFDSAIGTLKVWGAVRASIAA